MIDRMAFMDWMMDRWTLLDLQGADTMIYERLSAKNDRHLTETVLEHLERFASDGLRTLCLAAAEVSGTPLTPAMLMNALTDCYGLDCSHLINSRLIRQVTPEFYEEWRLQFEEASAAIHNREERVADVSASVRNTST